MPDSSALAHISAALQHLRASRPLVTSLTNYVVMNTTANALLAIGASPIMAHSRLEMDELMQLSGALVINLGTLDADWIPRMVHAIERANEHRRPVVLDPVGCGATRLRTATAQQLAAQAETLIVRGNASEIIALAGRPARSKGVDALDHSHTALDAADRLLQKGATSVVISGASDYVLSRQAGFRLDNGHPMLPQVTGMGCTLSALTGAFAAVGELSGLAATAIMGVAGQQAAEQAQGPGSLQVKLLDCLYRIDEDRLRRRLALTRLA